MNILFWNTSPQNSENIEKCLIELVLEKDCDIVVLAEYANATEQLSNLINKYSTAKYKSMSETVGCDRIKGIIKQKHTVSEPSEMSHYQIVAIETANKKFLLAMIHNISKLYGKVREQEDKIRRFCREILEQESKYNTKNTVVIGDFNIAPFEPACVSADMFHAIPYIEIAQKESRIVSEEKREMFYSPMWKFLSSSKPPYASYFCDAGGKLENYYWHMFDQIIVRPHLIEALDYEKLTILTQTKSHTLLNGNTLKPDKENYSDHLPIFCRLKEDNIL